VKLSHELTIVVTMFMKNLKKIDGAVLFYRLPNVYDGLIKIFFYKSINTKLIYKTINITFEQLNFHRSWLL
jgi:hypothetical protein